MPTPFNPDYNAILDSFADGVRQDEADRAAAAERETEALMNDLYEEIENNLACGAYVGDELSDGARDLLAQINQNVPRARWLRDPRYYWAKARIDLEIESEEAFIAAGGKARGNSDFRKALMYAKQTGHDLYDTLARLDSEAGKVQAQEEAEAKRKAEEEARLAAEKAAHAEAEEAEQRRLDSEQRRKNEETNRILAEEAANRQRELEERARIAEERQRYAAIFEIDVQGTLTKYLKRDSYVTIPDCVTSIGGHAFENCRELVSVTISEGVTSISAHAFDGCYSLTTVKIPRSLTNIGNNAFDKCNRIQSVHITDLNAWCRIQFENRAAQPLQAGAILYLNNTPVKDLVIPQGITNVNYTISGCTSLTSVTIPSSVTSIGQYAFQNCTSLTSVTIPSSVTSIGQYAFQNCTSLTSVTIPSSVTSIEDHAFSGCRSLTSVDIPSSVTGIGQYAFEKCTSLTSVTIPSSMTSIGNSVFYECTSLTSVTIPSSVTGIGNSAFFGCTSLTSVTILSSVTSIDRYAFCGCISLKSVRVPNQCEFDLWSFPDTCQIIRY